MSRRSWLLVSLLGAVVGLTLLVMNLILSKVEEDQLFDLEQRLGATARTLAAAVVDPLSRGDKQALENLLLSTQESDLSRLRVLDSHRHLVADSYGPISEPEGVRFRPEIQAAFTGRYGAYTRFADESQKSLALYVAVPVTVGEKIIGAVYVSRSTDGILQRLGVIRRSFHGALLLMSAVIFFGTLWVVRNFSQDLRRLGKVSELEDFQPQGQDAVDRMSQSLHYLVDSLRAKVAELEDEQDKTRRFIEDIAHELKTPVTGLRGAVEGMKSSGPDHPMFPTIERESERLARLTTLLLELRKLEYYELKPRLFDLSSLIDIVLESFRTTPGVKLVEDLPEECPIIGDPAKIQRVVENLVENALRCAPEGTEVTVALRVEGETVVITVSDLGPGIRAEDAEQIFGRGARGSGPVGHLGLGLAVAAQVVNLHGGEFGLDRERSVGATFYVRLPKGILPELTSRQ